MPVPTAPTTAVAGQPTRASLQFNALSAQVAFLLSPPITVMFAAAVQSIPTSAFTSIIFQNSDEVIDRDGSHTGASSRFTAVTAGWYQVDAGVCFAANTTGRRYIQLAVNGTAVPGSVRYTPASATGVAAVGVSKKVFLNVADFLEVQGFQDSGAALNTQTGGSQCCHIDVSFISQ